MLGTNLVLLGFDATGTAQPPTRRSGAAASTGSSPRPRRLDGGFVALTYAYYNTWSKKLRRFDAAGTLVTALNGPVVNTDDVRLLVPVGGTSVLMVGSIGGQETLQELALSDGHLVASGSYGNAWSELPRQLVSRPDGTVFTSTTSRVVRWTAARQVDPAFTAIPVSGSSRFVLADGTVRIWTDGTVRQYHSNGTATGAAVTIALSTGTTDHLHDATLAPDGRLLVAASVEHLAGIRVLRFLVDGSLDASFDPEGAIQLPAWSDARVVGADDLGRTYLADDSGGTARLDPTGHLDTGWGTGGFVPVDPRPPSRRAPLAGARARRAPRPARRQ
ncbi:MAG: delta-60 repeat domain-containing protein [Ilumatobacteraceae bacterium]